jgi:hypothetical protein
MKTLLPTIKKHGFTYTQVLRGKRSCIYEQRVAESIAYFEVFLIKVKPPQVYTSGRKYPEREVFPCNEDFGKTAWTCRSIEDAMIRYDWLEGAIM